MLRSALTRSSRVVLLKELSARYVHTTMGLLGAKPFGMPAMSPTMEKGAVVEWKFKVGEPFSAGDVILEVETDKAQIDVEAQDDGKLAKIVIDNGVKDVIVGETIAYLAEVDDDLSTLQFPKEVKKKKSTSKKSKIENPSSSSDQKIKPKEQPKKEDSEKKVSKPISGDILQAANQDQILLPSVAILLAENGISRAEAIQKIKGSGKDGRLLKGDVLAYLGKIPHESVVNIAEYVKSGEHLDLSNIELRVQKSEENKPISEQAGKKPIKSEPVILSEQISLQVPANVTHEELQKSLRSYIDEACQYCHEKPLSNTRSDYYDPVFEALITPAPTEPRFKVTYQLVSVTDELTSKGHEDIFDLLSDSGKSEPTTKSTPPSMNDYVLSFNVEVGGEYGDSRGKSENFIEYMKQLEIS